MDPERDTTRIGDLSIDGPVEGRCPACGNTDSIYLETRHNSVTPGGEPIDEVIGMPGWLGALVGSRTVRRRCAVCDCRFPAALSAGIKVLLLGLGAILMVVALVLLVHFHGPLGAWFQRMARQNPAVIVMIASLVGSVVIVVAFVRLYQAKRPLE